MKTTDVRNKKVPTFGIKKKLMVVKIYFIFYYILVELFTKKS
jgi:hypothetical protein